MLKPSKHHNCDTDGHSDPDNSGQCIYCSLIVDSFEDAVAAIQRYVIMDGAPEPIDDECLGDFMRTEDVLRVFNFYKR